MTDVQDPLVLHLRGTRLATRLAILHHGHPFESTVVVCVANPKFPSVSWILPACRDPAMRDLAALVLHLLATVVRLAGPGGVGASVTESGTRQAVLVILNRSRRRSPISAS